MSLEKGIFSQRELQSYCWKKLFSPIATNLKRIIKAHLRFFFLSNSCLMKNWWLWNWKKIVEQLKEKSFLSRISEKEILFKNTRNFSFESFCSKTWDKNSNLKTFKLKRFSFFPWNNTGLAAIQSLKTAIRSSLLAESFFKKTSWISGKKTSTQDEILNYFFNPFRKFPLRLFWNKREADY